jgi:LysM repeat protein/predicted esterase
MRWVAVILALAVLGLCASAAYAARPRIHVVAQGHTLGKIARRYNVSIDAICTANGIQRRQPIRVGQKLIIPDKNDKDGRRAAQARLRGDFRPKSSQRSRRHRESSVHVVAKGQTLGGIAQRYDVSIDAICTANGIERRRPIGIGQKLIIPGSDDSNGERAAQARLQRRDSTERSGKSAESGPQVLEIPAAPPVYYYPPIGPGRLTLRPVIFYLHGGGGYPRADCQRWAPVARRRGWLVCPTGPAKREDGRPRWGNWVAARRVVMATLEALRAKYGRRVQLYGNTLIGFSEGAFAAMNIGVHEPRTFNRWLILAGTDRYWGGPGLEALQRNRQRIRRVYLLTGEHDLTLEGTKRVLSRLRRAQVEAKFYELNGYGHQVPLRSKGWLYEAALSWLEHGGKVPTTELVGSAQQQAQR